MAAFYVSLGLFSEQLVGGLPPAPEAMQAYLSSGLPKLFGFAILFSLVSFIFYIAIVDRVDNVANRREDSFVEALEVGLKKFPATLLALILYLITVMLASALFIVPGLILSLSLAFNLYFIVLEDLGGYAALKASHELVWGNWWRTMTVFMAPGIVLLGFYFALIMLASLLGAVNSPLIGIVANLLSAFITPYFFTLAYVQFHDLRLRKSGADLAVRLAK